ncbi:hypothetical protein [Actinoplanes sp. HUAS TT8]|uniref:hypothetical protein n=1 Tax=Actinoplanes sp. HUAS TT8 TaxID=3447453 RepID=UPI003F5276F4
MEISDVDWFACAEPGPARSIPLRLRELRNATDDGAAIEATHALHELLCYGAVTVEEATVPAVRILYTILADAEFRWNQYVLQLLDTIACVDMVAESDSGQVASSSLGARVRSEIIDGLPLVEAATNSEVRDIRGAAIVLLADAAEDSSNMFERFSAELVQERDPVVQADLAYAATTCCFRKLKAAASGSCSAWLDSVLAHPNPAVRYRVAQRLVELKVEHRGAALLPILQSSEAEVVQKRLFRQEYM